MSEVLLGTIKYYEEMVEQSRGSERAQGFRAFYRVPTIGHPSRASRTRRGRASVRGRCEAATGWGLKTMVPADRHTCC
jgi:hypothetical protein